MPSCGGVEEQSSEPPLGWIPNEPWHPPGDKFPAIGKEVWIQEAGGKSSQGVIVRPPNAQGKWGLAVKIGSKDEDWNGIYWYSPERFIPRNPKG